MKALAVLTVGAALGVAAPPTASRPASAMPPSEAAVCAALDDFAARDRAAGLNEMKLADLREERGRALLEAVPGRRFTGWLGTIVDLHEGFEGKVVLKVKLPCRGKLETWGSFVSDLFDRTQIPRDSALYPVVTGMKAGGEVVVSGRFVSSREDGFREASVDEPTSMKHPKFIVHFDSIAGRPPE